MAGEEEESPIRPGVTNGRKEPRWVVAFLRALERTGEARVAAKDAGIDFTTAYARRRAHGEFAQAWAEALAAHDVRVTAEEEAEIAAVERGGLQAGPSTIASAGNGPPSQAQLREDVVVCAGKVRRRGHGRWSKAKEKVFFEELAATANMRMAADAAGVSTNAIRARRHKSRLFAAKFDAVVRNAGAVIDLYLVEEARKTFDPETIDSGDVQPRVTIDQAIKISQLNAAKAKREGAAGNPFEDEQDEPEYDYHEDVADIRERIVRKLQLMKKRDMPDMIAQGWSYDERYDHMVPPGWIHGPDYGPRPEEPPTR